MNDERLSEIAAAAAKALENSGLDNQSLKRLSEAAGKLDHQQADSIKKLVEAARINYDPAVITKLGQISAAVRATYDPNSASILSQISKASIDLKLSAASVQWLKQPALADPSLRRIGESTRLAFAGLSGKDTGLANALAGLNAIPRLTISEQFLQSPVLTDLRRTNESIRAKLVALPSTPSKLQVSGEAVAAALAEATAHVAQASEQHGHGDAVSTPVGVQSGGALSQRQQELVAAVYLIGCLLFIAGWFREEKLDFTAAGLFVNLAASVMAWIYVTGNAPPAAE